MRILSFWLVQNLSYFLDASFRAEEGFSPRRVAEVTRQAGMTDQKENNEGRLL
jgi:hypothetical protein